jgi:selenocysteine lyase/cysteine desulfurase
MDLCEARPDPFIRWDYPDYLDVAREAVAKVINAPTETVVFVPNATLGVNTVLKNLVWHEDGKDEILYFNTIYGACGKTVNYVSENTRGIVKGRQIDISYPAEDSDILTAFKKAIKASRAERKVPRVAIFDVVSSLPGMRAPFEQLTALCREEGVLSLIDGAHGIGHVHLDLSAFDPDFFVSNCHKWFFVPRGCAVFYVPVRNQDLIRSTIPTSHGFVPKLGASTGLPNPLERSPTKSDFVINFEFVGTIDNSNYLVVPEAIKWREQVCGGEKAVIEYNTKLARDGGKLVADYLGTHILDNSTHTLTDCCLVNIALPLTASPEKIEGKHTIKPEYAMGAVMWIQKTLTYEYHTFIAIFYFQDQWWARLSGQVYLELADFGWAAKVLKETCEKAAEQEIF